MPQRLRRLDTALGGFVERQSLAFIEAQQDDFGHRLISPPCERSGCRCRPAARRPPLAKIPTARRKGDRRRRRSAVVGSRHSPSGRVRVNAQTPNGDGTGPTWQKTGRALGAGGDGRRRPRRGSFVRNRRATAPRGSRSSWARASAHFSAGTRSLM
jgi:hypothetical protein